MAKSDEEVKYCWAEQFAKYSCLLVTLNNNAREANLVAMKLWN